MCCLIVYFIISRISIIYSFHIFLYSSIHIIYSLFIYVFTIYSTIYLRIHYSFTYSLFIYVFIIYYSLFTIHIHIYYSFTIHIRIYLRIYYSFTYSSENSYLMEFDETTKFWYQRVACDVWITLSIGPTNSDLQNAVDLRKYRNFGFSKILIKISAKSLVFGTHV